MQDSDRGDNIDKTLDEIKQGNRNFEELMEKTKSLEIELKERESQYLSLFNNNHSVMLIVDRDSGRIYDANPAACDYYGYTREQFKMLNISDINAMSANEISLAEDRAAKDGCNNVLLKHILSNALVRDVEIFSGTIHIEGKKYTYMNVHDITDKILAEKRLKKEQELLRIALLASKFYLRESNLETQEVFQSEEMLRDLGYTKDEYPETVEELRSFFHPDDLAMVLENINSLTKYNKESFDVEFRFKAKNGDWVWLSAIGKVVEWDKDSKPIRLVGLSTDISEKKKISEEREKMIDELQRKNRIIEDNMHELAALNRKLADSEENLKELNSTKDKFFSIIAHDLKGPLSSFHTITELMAKEYDDFEEEERLQFIQDLSKSSKNLYELLENLLQWSRAQTGRIEYNPDMTDLKFISDSNIALLTMNAQKKNISLVNEIPEGSTAFFDPNMVTTVLRNLISNAIKFTPEGGQITLACKNASDMLEVSVSDNGVGISEDGLNKIFRIDKQHTTLGTSNEKGTGLGLILCKEFVEINKGKIGVESTEGVGTTFKFTLPAK